MIVYVQVLSNMLCGLQVIAMAEAMLIGKIAEQVKCKTFLKYDIL